MVKFFEIHLVALTIQELEPKVKDNQAWIVVGRSLNQISINVIVMLLKGKNGCYIWL